MCSFMIILLLNFIVYGLFIIILKVKVKFVPFLYIVSCLGWDSVRNIQFTDNYYLVLKALI